jgi:GntR family transcriptional regulator
MTSSQPAPAADLLPRIGQGSLSDQTTEALLQAILDRRFPDDRLPNEPDLAQQMGVSRTTIRSALQALDRLGVISRTPGRGTRLRPHIGRESMMLHRVIGFRGMLEGQYDDVRVEQSFAVADHGSEPAMAALGLDETMPVLINDKVYLADGEPAVHLLQEVPISHLLPGQAEQLVDGTLTAPATIFDFSRTWPGREIDHSVAELIPQVVPKDPRSRRFRLTMAVGTPFLELRETHYSEGNEPVAFACEAVHDQLVRLRLVRTR